MGRRDLETKRDENTLNHFVEKLQLIANTNMVTKEALLQKFVAKYVLKTKMITVAGQMFIKYEKELEISNQMSKGYEKYIGGDNNTKSDTLDKVCGDIVKINCFDRDEVFRNKSINRFAKILKNKKREWQSNKKVLWKKASILFYQFFYTLGINFHSNVIDILLHLLCS